MAMRKDHKLRRTVKILLVRKREEDENRKSKHLKLGFEGELGIEDRSMIEEGEIQVIEITLTKSITVEGNLVMRQNN